MRTGAWISSHNFYYECVYKSYEEFTESLSSLKAKEKQLQRQYSQEESNIIEHLIDHETNELQNESYRIATSTFLFICMTIEAFLNHYGSKRLLENYYKRNLERIGITEKLSLLLLIFFDIKLESNDPLLKRTRNLFDRRNQLVHPKTREIETSRMKEYVNKHPNEIELGKNIEDMEYIIKRFCELDADINRNFDFRRPTKS